MNLLLSLTEQCNLRCSYCYYKESQVERANVMSNEVLEASLQLAFERTIQLKHVSLNITFFGGEPLLRFDAIKKTVKQAKKLAREHHGELPNDFQLRFFINTNGTLITESILDYLKKEKIQPLLSLDGPERKHNISRKKIDGTGSFQDISKWIPSLVEMDATALMVITRKHIRGLSRAIKWVFDQGFNSIATAIDFDGKWTETDMAALSIEYQKIALLWLKMRKQNPNLYLSTIQDKISYILLDKRQRHNNCFILKGAIGIATNGNAFPCSRFITSSDDAKYVLGNVLDKNNHIFTGSVAKDICHFLKYDKPECKGCSIRYRCSAHECGCTAFYTTGSIYGVSPEVCAHERILTSICDEILAKRQALGELF